MGYYGAKQKEREDRAERLGWYIYENKVTVREAAQVFQVSKSTVYEDITEILPTLSSVLAQAVQKVLAQNKAERHIRGGATTKRKYAKKR